MMSKRRATLASVKSVATLSKVCSSHSKLKFPHKFIDAIRTFTLVKHLSTAAEISYFQAEHSIVGENPDDSGEGSPLDCQNNNSNGYYQNPDAFHRQSLGVSQQNPSGFYRENVREYQQNPDRFHAESLREEFQQNLVAQVGKFNNSHLENARNSNGFAADLRRPNVYPREQSCQQNLLESYKASGSEIQQRPNEFYQWNPNGHCRENTGQFQQNPNGYHREIVRQFQPNPNGYSIENASVGQFQRSSNGHQSGNVGQFQQNPNGYQSGSVGQFQQIPKGYYSESVGIVGQFQQNPNGYQSGSVGQFQQIPNGYYSESVGMVRQFQQNTNDLQREMLGTQATNDVKQVETAENRQFMGTIDELDAFCKEGKVKEAVEVLGLLEKQNMSVDLPRYLQLMQACGEAKALQEIKSVYDYLIRSMGPVKVSIHNKVLEMYSKCGSMSDAYELFEKMPERNMTTWDTMITWLAKNGLGEDAIDMFTRFKEARLRPDGQMFIGVFSACSTLGDISEGMLHFESMSKDFGIVPSMEHYVSVVDMLGSTGYLDEAVEFIEKMPFEPSVDVWETLMNHCRVHGNMELGDRCAELVDCLDPSRLTDQSRAGLVPVKASDLTKQKEKKKSSGQNLLEVRSRVHEYRAGDTSHPEKDKIYAQLKAMNAQMREAGYVPDTRFVLHDIEQEGKEEALLCHSERLAVSYGLINSAARSSIRIIKNLRVCGDCHNALKIISKLVGRQLIIRDAKRFHHFENGLCSCRDYW
ncbi:pentatricopeptide repeat-containing protein At4g32450, mitochondrial-like [Telopea speciosissima]|uniref:pentatricopeptide repeat-containing protein At4g32450, mitochondrial-like n=1 Tax=Telopea speciosissima TaxID=54955 RepID=UPI001CC54405|nr:pentatricopeptide repeat-containing protein At4g32450, mitochondrial-like [Telopea speciosissima]